MGRRGDTLSCNFNVADQLRRWRAAHTFAGAASRAASQQLAGASAWAVAAVAGGSRNWSSSLLPARLRTSSSWGLRRKPSRSASDGLLSLVVQDPRGGFAAGPPCSRPPAWPRTAEATSSGATTAARSAACRRLSAGDRALRVSDLALKEWLFRVAATACDPELAPWRVGSVRLGGLWRATTRSVGSVWEGAHDKGLLLSTEHECDRTRSLCVTLAPCRDHHASE